MARILLKMVTVGIYGCLHEQKNENWCTQNAHDTFKSCIFTTLSVQSIIGATLIRRPATTLDFSAFPSGHCLFSFIRFITIYMINHLTHNVVLQDCYVMASVIKVGTQWRAQLRRRGFPTDTRLSHRRACQRLGGHNRVADAGDEAPILAYHIKNDAGRPGRQVYKGDRRAVAQ